MRRDGPRRRIRTKRKYIIESTRDPVLFTDGRIVHTVGGVYGT
jgi:hypothetical protein